jgi:hypothetical protein
MARQQPYINKLDDYIGAFYEDELEAKLKSSKLILELFQDFANLESLLEHGTPPDTQIPSCPSSVERWHRTTSGTSICRSTS